MAFSYYRKITIDHTKVSSDQTNFPVLISGTYGYLATIANGGNVTSANGYDIAFYTDATAATKLDHEIESYLATDGTVSIWVRIPSLSSSVDTDIYMFYGDSGLGRSMENKTGVWDSSFKGVWHLGDGTTINVSDSVALNSVTNNGITSGSGKIGGAGSFNGSSKYASIAVGNPIGPLTTNVTYEAWINTASVAAGVANIIASARLTTANGMALARNAAGLRFTTYAVKDYDSTLITLTTSTWYHVAAVMSGFNVTFYLNGSNIQTVTGVANGNANSDDLIYIGAATIGGSGTPTNYFNGSIDELRVSNSVRSDGWIQTGYNNQNDPASFYSIDSSATSALRTIQGVQTIQGIQTIQL